MSETLHKDQVEPNLHINKVHKTTHQDGGTDKISVAGLSGVLADAQNADKIKGIPVSVTGIQNGDILEYNALVPNFIPKPNLYRIIDTLDVKASCRLATTGPITLSGEQTIDGKSAVEGDRILVKNQASGQYNGIYVCMATAWTRATDADTSQEVTCGMYTYITDGDTLSGQAWVLSTKDPIVLGTTVLVFSQFNSSTNNFVDLLDVPSSYSGQGGKALFVTAGANGIEFNALPAAPVTSLIAGTNITLTPSSGLGDVTIDAAGGSGKTVLWLTPGTAILPNSYFGRLQKVTRTNGVDYIIKFLADGVADPNDEVAYWTIPMPAFYAGGNLTITVYSLSEDTNVAHLAKFYLECRAITHDEAWDAAHTAIGNVDINPTAAARDVLVDTIAWTANKPSAGDMLSIKVYVDHSASTYSVGNKDCEILAIKIEEN